MKMKIKIISIQDIANHPNLSFSVKDYLHMQPKEIINKGIEINEENNIQGN